MTAPASDEHHHSSPAPVASGKETAHHHAHDHSSHPFFHEHGLYHVHNRTPIGVMGAHSHDAGEWMVSYRYMHMNMSGNRSGTDRLRVSDVFGEGFMVAPTRMTMAMHMFGAMYAPTDRITLMAMVPYVRMFMDHVTMGGTRFTTRSDGLGDVKFGGNYALVKTDDQQLLFNAAISFPTGSISQRDTTPAGPNQKLPYPMQLGSGTYDLLPGMTYTGQSGNWYWGGQAMGVIRTGTNSQGYRLGNRGTLTTWVSKYWTEWFGNSMRFEGQKWGNIHGRDSELNPAMIPTADPNRRGGERIDLLLGANLDGQGKWLEGHRVGVEFGFPIYQSLDGPQLKTDWLVTVGWQYTW